MPGSRNVDIQLFLNESRFSPFQWTVFACASPSCCWTVSIPPPSASSRRRWSPNGASATGARPGPERRAFRPGRGRAIHRSARRQVRAQAGTDILGAGVRCRQFRSSFSTDMTMLTVFRFVTGLGLGAAMPNAVTLMNEFCPDSRRATLTNAMFCGFPLGAALGGFLAAWMIPMWGWRSVLQLGGIAPLILTVLLRSLAPGIDQVHGRQSTRR